ncbi:MAG: Ig-like domain-containing protein [Oscillibacter ruminantium]|uniref:Ig-like domain-containing protein n=1 Tax=Oscillibacter ruminantium TaxID=1263547 RepID=UPI002B1F04CA|nr:Ig-like domain-containing protein [Oscillibacter ruminantium]MEA5041561.1 Ig-like domain-containing protein [Oscillibacter ruminantium]
MAMKRCPVCGEKYSDTYRYCPFCEEEEAMKGDRPLRRRGGKRSSSRKDPGILTPVLVIVVLVLALMLGWLFFGDSIKEKLSGGNSGAASSQSSQSQSGSSASGSAGALEPGDSSVEPGDSSQTGTGTGTGNGELSVEEVAALPDTLKLSTGDFTISVGDPTVKLKATGGSGTYTWYSEDDGIASVDENGTVTAISAGTINVYATDGSGKGLCIVRVKGGAATPSSTGTTGTTGQTTPSGGEVKLNREDFTLPVGETFQLKNTGITTTQTWSSSNPSVATVSGNGTVTGVSAGTATITMSYDGNSLSCIVRVK